MKLPISKSLEILTSCVSHCQASNPTDLRVSQLFIVDFVDKSDKPECSSNCWKCLKQNK